MRNLDRYFMEGQNTYTESVWKDAEKLVDFFWVSLRFHFASVVAAKRDGGSSQGSDYFKYKYMTLEPVTSPKTLMS